MSSKSLPSFPRTVPTFRRRPLLRGVPRVGSPTSSLILRRSDFSSSLPPRFVSFAWRYLVYASCSCPSAPSASAPTRATRRSCRPRACCAECPMIRFSRGDRRDLPGSWAALAYVPRSQIPSEPMRRGPGLCALSLDAPMLPSVSRTTSASKTSILSGLKSSARTPAVYASSAPHGALDARLASGW